MKCWTSRLWFPLVLSRRQMNTTSSWSTKQVLCACEDVLHLLPVTLCPTICAPLFCSKVKSGVHLRHLKRTASSSLMTCPMGRWAHWRPLWRPWRSSSLIWLSCLGSTWWRVKAGSCGRHGWKRSDKLEFVIVGLFFFFSVDMGTYYITALLVTSFEGRNIDWLTWTERTHKHDINSPSVLINFYNINNNLLLNKSRLGKKEIKVIVFAGHGSHIWYS